MCIAIVWAFAAIAVAVLPYISSYLGDNGYIPDDNIGSEITESVPKDDTTPNVAEGEKEYDEQPEGGSRYDTVA